MTFLSIRCNLCGGEHEVSDDGALITRCREYEDNLQCVTLRARVRNLTAIVAGITNERAYFKARGDKWKASFQDVSRMNEKLRRENAALKRRVYELEHAQQEPWLVRKLVSMVREARR